MKNQHEGVQFYIMFAGKDYRYEKNSASRMRYSVYHQGRLVKGKLLRLPDPPTRLRIERLLIVSETQPTILNVMWGSQYLGLPRRFLVKYRQKNTSDDVLNRQITHETQLSIPVELGLAVDIRVAVETCISSSDFSASFVIFISPIFKRLCQV